MSTPWKLYCRTLNSTSLAVWKKIDDISRRRETSYLNVKKVYLTLRTAKLLSASRVFTHVDVSVFHRKYGLGQSKLEQGFSQHRELLDSHDLHLTPSVLMVEMYPSEHWKESRQIMSCF